MELSIKNHNICRHCNTESQFYLILENGGIVVWCPNCGTVMIEHNGDRVWTHTPYISKKAKELENEK